MWAGFILGKDYYPVFHSTLERFEVKYLSQMIGERKETYNIVSSLRV
jgi:hypothetical protein